MSSAAKSEVFPAEQDTSEAVFHASVPQVWLAMDEPELRTRLADILRGDGLNVVEVDDTSALLSYMRDPLFPRFARDSDNLVIVDERAEAEPDALELLRVMRRSRCEWPVIVLSDDCNADTQAAAAKLAPSYVFKRASAPSSLRLAVWNLLAP